jgi:hypothetical protein
MSAPYDDGMHRMRMRAPAKLCSRLWAFQPRASSRKHDMTSMPLHLRHVCAVAAMAAMAAMATMAAAKSTAIAWCSTSRSYCFPTWVGVWSRGGAQCCFRTRQLRLGPTGSRDPIHDFHCEVHLPMDPRIHARIARCLARANGIVGQLVPGAPCRRLALLRGRARYRVGERQTAVFSQG